MENNTEYKIDALRSSVVYDQILGLISNAMDLSHVPNENIVRFYFEDPEHSIDIDHMHEECVDLLKEANIQAQLIDNLRKIKQGQDSSQTEDSVFRDTDRQIRDAERQQKKCLKDATDLYNLYQCLARRTGRDPLDPPDGIEIDPLHVRSEPISDYEIFYLSYHYLGLQANRSPLGTLALKMLQYFENNHPEDAQGKIDNTLALATEKPTFLTRALLDLFKKANSLAEYREKILRFKDKPLAMSEVRSAYQALKNEQLKAPVNEEPKPKTRTTFLSRLFKPAPEDRKPDPSFQEQLMAKVSGKDAHKDVQALNLMQFENNLSIFGILSKDLITVLDTCYGNVEQDDEQYLALKVRLGEVSFDEIREASIFGYQPPTEEDTNRQGLKKK